MTSPVENSEDVPTHKGASLAREKMQNGEDEKKKVQELDGARIIIEKEQKRKEEEKERTKTEIEDKWEREEGRERKITVTMASVTLSKRTVSLFGVVMLLLVRIQCSLLSSYKKRKSLLMQVMYIFVFSLLL